MCWLINLRFAQITAFLMNQKIPISFPNNITVEIKREDLLHPFISGNKFRKLKYNILEAQNLEKKTLLTFGGAFSNHIAAVAAAGEKYDIETIGIIRGEELIKKIDENPTLTFAQNCGMKFEFWTRELYRQKDSQDVLKKLYDKYPFAYILPEGGTNQLAVKGCEEILSREDAKFDYICCAVGTGGTISGLINSSFSAQKVLGFPVVRDLNLGEIVAEATNNRRWNLICEYHFGGYAKINAELVHFINDFKNKTKIQLDPIYTAKMVFGVVDLINKNYFESNSRILLIHTGGLQGISGMNNFLRNKQLPIIQYND